MNERDELALRIAKEMYVGEETTFQRYNLGEYARRLFAAWQGSQEPVAWKIEQEKPGFSPFAVLHESQAMGYKNAGWTVTPLYAPQAKIEELTTGKEAMRLEGMEEAAKICELEHVYSDSVRTEAYNDAIDDCVAAIRAEISRRRAKEGGG